MTKKYNQLSLEQRYTIAALHEQGYLQSKIADIIGVHKSTISRELKRNMPQRGIGAKVYNAEKAEHKTRERHRLKPKRHKFTLDLKLQLKTWMVDRRYSPELASAQWKKEGVSGVSHETIYQFIWQCKHTNKAEDRPFKDLHKQLKHGHRRRKRGNYKHTRDRIPNRVPIEKRPKIVEKRIRFGDIEVDLVMGKGHKSALLVTVDRATLKTTIDKLTGKDANKITKKLIKRMKRYPPIKTMTFDNDLAFSQHEEIAKALNVKTYFTRPYTSQDKGTIENRNGVIRLFFPKKTDFNKIDNREIKRVEKEINNRPIRKFGYDTANEVFLRFEGSVALIA
ncbi:Transposase and inactivated derivatives, IS30 family [Arachidicoccus rhizosphaerae]|jgi:IS30 family transposase|uniref:Transposase and inactivated derivatives, IS30 family n=1 Tax=Arachidicoccus rhizosphaerae TaxID=551991 RepID=A0A1H3Y7Y7_9BACT|nr:IS30 family transposase [Arachidicoccus rhizosphaerae]SEA07769.1 Transposase and inactivated derivatives, IS30 family [Arachidicoccus rhizosphaerae]SEA65428.1 Transposase and inactivated derivatives, IS30 family [Arachidicoccus rhizosphaerae]